MKKSFCFLFALGTCLSQYALGTEILLEAQGAYYLPTDATFKKIYYESGIYGLETSIQTWKNLYTWMSASLFTKSGQSIGLENNTNITFIPIGVGLKYLWKVKSVDLYGGLGALPTYLNIHDQSSYVTQKTRKWGCGGVAKIGAIINLPQSFFIDLFSSYSYINISNHTTYEKKVYDHSANLSGYSFGLGIGYRFGSK